MAKKKESTSTPKSAAKLAIKAAFAELDEAKASGDKALIAEKAAAVKALM